MSNVFLVALGGAIGAVLRYAISGWAHSAFGEAFPWGTLSANLLGCFAIGFLWILSERAWLSPHAGTLLLTGLVGAFTTFSTYGLESLNLLREGAVLQGLLNLLLSNLIGLGLVFLGIVAARSMIDWVGAPS